MLDNKVKIIIMPKEIAERYLLKLPPIGEG